MAEQGYDQHGRKYFFLADLDKRNGSGTAPEDAAIDNEDRQPATAETANLVSSEVGYPNLPGMEGKFHKPVLDFDLPIRAIPSTTEGHFHLYIDRAMSWDDYEKLLTVLGEVKLLEPGYVGAALRRKATFVRPPNVKKPPAKTPLEQDIEDGIC